MRTLAPTSCRTTRRTPCRLDHHHDAHNDDSCSSTRGGATRRRAPLPPAPPAQAVSTCTLSTPSRDATRRSPTRRSLRSRRAHIHDSRRYATLADATLAPARGALPPTLPCRALRSRRLLRQGDRGLAAGSAGGSSFRPSLFVWVPQQHDARNVPRLPLEFLEGDVAQPRRNAKLQVGEKFGAALAEIMVIPRSTLNAMPVPQRLNASHPTLTTHVSVATLHPCPPATLGSRHPPFARIVM